MKRLVFVMGLMGCLGFVGCRTHERVVEVVRTDTLIQTKVQRDSVYIEKEKHDSVYIHQKGDTLLIEKWHTEWRDRWREKERHDTLYVAKHDTVRVKELVTKQNGEKRVRMAVGDLVLLAVVLFAVVLGIKWVIMKFVRP